MAGGSAAVFRTGRLLESLLAEPWSLLVIRTDRPFCRSRPGRFLATGAAAMMLVAIALPRLPGEVAFGFVPLPPSILSTILVIAGLCVVAA